MYAALTFLALITCGVTANFEDDIFASSGDPKDNYFRYVRTYSQDDFNDDTIREISEDIPKPYGFQIYYPQHSQRSLRTRREDVMDTSKEVSETPPSISTTDKLLNIDESLKPLELDILEAEDASNSSDSSVAASEVPDEMVINDFIRFKRELEKNSEVETLEPGTDGFRPKREPERNGKMLLSDGQVLDTNREPRGAVQEKWLKQPYPVQVSNLNRDQNRRNFDDNPSHGDAPNVPRVHFVTQRRSDSSPPLVYHSYEGRDREGRSRELTRQRDIDLERDFEPVYYPRPARHYNAQLGGPGQESSGVRRTEVYRNYERDSRDRDFRNDPRDGRNSYNRDFDRDRRFYQQDRFYEEDRPTPSVVKNKRIIYYATLPEIVRTQGGDRDRDRNRDRDNFDRDTDRDSYRRRFNDERDRVRDRDRDRDTGRDQTLSAINYRFRNESPYDNRDRDPQVDKSRYDETATAKSGAYQGTKVSSADVSVRTLKKNPERRVYSEVGRRFPEGYHSEAGTPAFENNHR